MVVGSTPRQVGKSQQVRTAQAVQSQIAEIAVSQPVQKEPAGNELFAKKSMEHFGKPIQCARMNNQKTDANDKFSLMKVKERQ